MPFWRSYYHLVWATNDRLPLLTPEALEVVEHSIRETAAKLQTIVHAFGGVSDHVHVVVSIPPRHSAAFVIGRMKGAATRSVNGSGLCGDATFSWQDEYGVMTFGQKAHADVCAYVKDQKRRHAERNVTPMLERLEDD